tara:strand:- start:303 stop:683 length:381 start_codon:yes stop_codon:yes gene_type:complete
MAKIDLKTTPEIFSLLVTADPAGSTTTQPMPINHVLSDRKYICAVPYCKQFGDFVGNEPGLSILLLDSLVGGNEIALIPLYPGNYVTLNPASLQCSAFQIINNQLENSIISFFKTMPQFLSRERTT